MADDRALTVGLLHFHRWSRWRSMAITLTDGGVRLGRVAGQVRTCSKCGKEKLRRV